MVRVAGINISDNKHIVISLTEIYGIGKSISKYICKKTNTPENVKTKDITEFQLDKIRKEINNYSIEGYLKKEIYLNIKRLIDINSYRGLRHKKNLPVRGQRTRTNAKTARKIKK